MKIEVLKNSLFNQFKEDVYKLVNKVYRDFESRLWGDDYERISQEELIYLSAQGSIYIAHDEGALLGVVKYLSMNEIEAEFGMLVTNPLYRGKGVASKMVSFVEKKAREEGRLQMRLEILKPVNEIHEDKERLDKWYTKIGYIESHKEAFSTMYPHLAPIIKIECDFVVYKKKLI